MALDNLLLRLMVLVEVAQLLGTVLPLAEANHGTVEVQERHVGVLEVGRVLRRGFHVPRLVLPLSQRFLRVVAVRRLVLILTSVVHSTVVVSA